MPAKTRLDKLPQQQKKILLDKKMTPQQKKIAKSKAKGKAESLKLQKFLSEKLFNPVFGLEIHLAIKPQLQAQTPLFTQQTTAHVVQVKDVEVFDKLVKAIENIVDEFI